MNLAGTATLRAKRWVSAKRRCGASSIRSDECLFTGIDLTCGAIPPHWIALANAVGASRRKCRALQAHMY